MNKNINILYISLKLVRTSLMLTEATLKCTNVLVNVEINTV